MEYVEDRLGRFMDDGVWTHYFRDLVGASEMIPIDSTRAFRVEARMPADELRGRVYMKVILSGFDLKYGPPW